MLEITNITTDPQTDDPRFKSDITTGIVMRDGKCIGSVLFPTEENVKEVVANQEEIGKPLDQGQIIKKHMAAFVPQPVLGLQPVFTDLELLQLSKMMTEKHHAVLTLLDEDRQAMGWKP